MGLKREDGPKNRDLTPAPPPLLPATRRWLVGIILAGAVLRIFPIWFGLPYPQARPDEETALAKALDVSAGELNPAFFHWPSVTFYIFGGAFRAAHLTHSLLAEPRDFTFSEHALIARAVVALAGTATIFVLFQLARLVAGERQALLAAAFLAVAILHVRESHFAMTDVLATLLVVTSLAHLLRGVRLPATDGAFDSISAGAVKWSAAAGLAAGLAASTKYSAAALAASMAAAQALWFWRTPGLALSWRGWLPSLAYGAAMLGGFVATTPYAFLDYDTFSRDLKFDFAHLADGHRVNLGRGWTYHFTHSLPYGVGVPVFATSLCGSAPFARHYTGAAFVLGAFAAAFYLAIGSGFTVFFRYMLPLVPLVCLSAAIGVGHAAEWLAPSPGRRRAVVLAVMMALTAGPALVHAAWFDLALARTDTRVLAGRWLERRLRPGDTLHDTGGNYTRLDLWPRTFHRWHYDEATGSFDDPARRAPDWLILQESPLTAYVSSPPALRQLAQTKYVRLYVVRGTRGGASSAVYDLQDAFFMPLSRFWTIERPGPDISIFRRRDLSPLDQGLSPAVRAQPGFPPGSQEGARVPAVRVPSG
ncbi:MAG TPA: phospholipid carrier-dependent glycosyltransferase [Vicinamibacterales bacterium]|nr:phospholipid carrier-dependent glycosyltransferase [Vicinamibacterales bacterium]